MKITVLSPSGSEYASVLEVADDFELPPLMGADDWLEIETAAGETWAIPMRFVIAVVLEAPQKKVKKRGRA